MITPEIRFGEPPDNKSDRQLEFCLTHAGNKKVIEHLHLFRGEGMTGTRAAFYLLSLFEPLPTSNDDMGLIKPGEKNPQTLWDQVGWTYTKPQKLTDEQRGALVALQYFTLESLANNPQVRKVHGEARDLSSQARQAAQNTFGAYDRYLASSLDPDNPTSIKILSSLKTVGKTARAVVVPTLFLLACKPLITKSQPTVKLTPTASQAYSASVETAVDQQADLEIPGAAPFSRSSGIISIPEFKEPNAECSLRRTKSPEGKGPFKFSEIADWDAIRGTLGSVWFVHEDPNGRIWVEPNKNKIKVSGYYWVEQPDGSVCYYRIDTTKASRKK